MWMLTHLHMLVAVVALAKQCPSVIELFEHAIRPNRAEQQRAIASTAAAICQFHNNILIRFDSIEMFAP